MGLIDGGRERAAGGFERKTSEKTRVRALSGDVTGRGVQFKSKKSNLCGMRLQIDVNVL